MDVLKSLNGWAKDLMGLTHYASGLCIFGMECSIVSISNVLQHGWPDQAVLDEAFVARMPPGWEIMKSESTSKRSSSQHARPYFSLLTSQKISRAFPIFKGFNLIRQVIGKEIKVLSSPHLWF
ncbi:hypothetical protein TNIN_386241 [Trichonephila inaurata madagascariensis]|uniref:Uncharacterized protein n=1 Tax=Trichonephila inaurata madagascariensis TaxID=2747483 RepID=A0A8X6MLX4_9ARAC|nr:hypothetical protein TNIN_386241 [Trichonephila inaurata madagascariensis]